MEKVVNGFAYKPGANELAATGWFAEGLLVVFFILGISYAMKLLEFLVFTVKV